MSEIMTIYDRLLAAQKMVVNPKVDAMGHSETTGDYGYSTLASILDIVRPACNENGLFLSQRVNSENRENMCIVTSVSCGSDALVLDCFPVNYETDPQKFGSAVTYAKRYSLISVFGISCRYEDNDGAMESAKTENKPAPRQLTESQKAVSDAMRKAKECGMSLVPLKEWAKAYFGEDVENLNDTDCEAFAIKINEEIAGHMQPVGKAERF